MAKKIKIIDIDTVCVLLACNRAHVYNNYLKNKILSPVPRVGRKSYFYHSEVDELLTTQLADVVARKYLKLRETTLLEKYKLVAEEFENTYTELTHKN